jgi:hypothetical protein
MDSEEILIVVIAVTVSVAVLYAAYWPVKWLVKWLRIAVIEKLKVDFEGNNIPSDPEDGRVVRLDKTLGFTERFIAVALIVVAPRQVAFFIAGWVALKFAANWKRKESGEPWEKVRNARFSLIALIGSAASFAIAVAVGLALRCILEEL